MTISKRIYFLVISMASFSLIAGAMAWFVLGRIENETNLIKNRNMELILTGEQIKLSVVQVQQWLTDISATRGAEGFSDGYDKAESWAKKFTENLRKMESLAADDKEIIESTKLLESKFADYYKMGKEMASVYIKYGPEEGNKFMGKFDPFAESLTNEIEHNNQLLIKPSETRFENFYKFISFVKISASLFFVLLGFGSLFVSYRITNSIDRSLKNTIDKLKTSSDSVSQASQKISEGGTNLSDQTTRQASAVHQTVSSSDEIKAMVMKNVEYSEKSQEISQINQTAVHNGQTAVQEMVTSVETIRQSINEIVDHMNKSNEEISDLSRIINEIGEKTKVINDIVFQTRLLSFNASVEAARSGEHGRGFSVVAEEIGKLAEVSGKSAQEISHILQLSTKKANEVIKKSKEGAESLLKTGIDNVNDGTEKAHLCERIFNEIYDHSQKVNEMLGEISTASREQEVGIGEVNRAIHLLNEATSSSQIIAQENSALAQTMNSEAQQLEDIVEELENMIKSKNKTTESHQPDLIAQN